ncbi:hypothetical protein [Oceanobacillus timonensis]|uniref:hypothetical protein n=1 Tax=Oceanobacillus timonensis TaxID=1926285 RepID=UPI0009BC6F88|nr:hypothetical protein [Oceanobacillus timonensis]
MKILLELIRIIVIFGILGALGWAMIGHIYTINEATETYSWLGAIAMLLLLFVLYRNKLQFSGWHKGKSKLPKSVTIVCILIAVMLFLLPFLIGEYLS